MNLTCLLKQCAWIHIGKGLYQCSRCKSISWGVNKDDKEICTNERNEELLNRIANGGDLTSEDTKYYPENKALITILNGNKTI